MIPLMILEYGMMLVGVVGGFLLLRRLANQALIVHYECKKATGHGWFLTGYWKHVHNRENYYRYLRLFEAGKVPSLDEMESSPAPVPTPAEIIGTSDTSRELGPAPRRETE